MMHYYTPGEFVEAATLEGGVYWLEADGADVIVTVPAGEPRRRYGLRGPLDGAIIVSGRGHGDAVREGDGYAYRRGSGYGIAIRWGDGAGSALTEED